MINTCQGSWGRHREAEPTGSRLLRQNPACCLHPAALSGHGKDPTLGRAQPDLPAREAGAPRPLSCFLPVVQAELPAASRGRDSAGVTMQRELPQQLGHPPTGAGETRGCLVVQGTPGDKSLPSTPARVVPLAVPLPAVEKDGTNVTSRWELTQLSAALSLGHAPCPSPGCPIPPCRRVPAKPLALLPAPRPQLSPSERRAGWCTQGPCHQPGERRGHPGHPPHHPGPALPGGWRLSWMASTSARSVQMPWPCMRVCRGRGTPRGG